MSFRKEGTQESKEEFKEEWKKPINVTKECQSLYDLPQRKIVSIGGVGSPGTAYNDNKKDYDQALKDWNRAATITPGKEDKKENAGQSIFIFVNDEKIALKDLLNKIFKNEEDKKRYELILNSNGNIVFKSNIGLKNFFADYLFVKVDDEKKKTALIDDALLHLHQGGLSVALSFLILENCKQTNDKQFRAPSVWSDTFRPIANGVSLSAEHKFTRLIENQISDVFLDEGIHAECKASIVVQENPALKTDHVLVKNKIDEAKFSLNDEKVKDYIFGKGFIKNYPEKQSLLNQLYSKYNEVLKDSSQFTQLNEKEKEKEKKKGHVSSRNKKNVLWDVIEKFKLLDLHDPEQLTSFQKFLQENMQGLNRTENTSPSYLSVAQVKMTNLLGKFKPQTTTHLLQEISKAIAKQQEKLQPPKLGSDR